MSVSNLTPEARAENATMLASALGLDVAKAAEALEFNVAISVLESDPIATLIAKEIHSILSRTVAVVELNDGYEAASVEIVVGASTAKSSAEKVFISVSNDRATISSGSSHTRCESIPNIYSVLVACYACAATMHRVFKERLPFEVSDPLIISFDQLGIDPRILSKPIEIGKTYLAGAGAIGNGFLWAARYLDLRGELVIADDDVVSSGNLNRQIWFTKDDINKPKADRLASHAQSQFPHLRLLPDQKRLQELSDRSNGPWLSRVLVAVDSRRARRKIQNEFPGEVFDASTTDIREVVVHHHKQPTQNACMSCIYHADLEENSREAHIAEHFGVSVAEVRQERISKDAAKVIAERFPKLSAPDIEGLAYDTLFKRLCGEGELKTLEGRRIVAPFAFVSVLAGTLLALDVARRLGSGGNKTDFNYWRVSPWHSPILRRQIMRPKERACDFCGNSVLAGVNKAMWGG